uniref:glycosyltransferase family 2 protein n=1 Tax=Cellulomonas endophytica TaxID=2494735 RepID=UPI0010107DF2
MTTGLHEPDAAPPLVVPAGPAPATARQVEPGPGAGSGLRPGTGVRPVDPALPAPPSDAEMVSYLGRQHRWVLVLQALSFVLVAVSATSFAVADLRLLLFLVPLSLFAVTMVVSLLSSSRRRRVDLASHRALLAAWRPDAVPSVDVLLPSAGEDLAVLANTYHHVAALEWDGTLRVLVLDDSARPEVAALAAAHGFEYLTRPDRGRLKKAGNLRYGYEHSSGDVLAVLDADFVPRPDYLRALVPYLDDPRVGIVQSPQYFDAVAGMGWLQRCAGATQEMFYRWIQPARDRSDAAICVGTCALYRRSALEASGGFAQIGHSEDVHTGVGMLRRGLVVRYVPVVLSKGLCPDDVRAFVTQQYRWCTGSMSLLADPSFHDDGFLTLRQRLCFWSGFLYYISTGVNAVVAPLPAVVMLWAFPAWVEPMNSVWLLGAVLLWLVVYPVVMRGHWRVDVLRVQYLYSFAHAVAIVDLVRGRTQEWVATGTTAAATGGRRASVATTVVRTTTLYAAVAQALLWTGLGHVTLTRGLEVTWAMVLLAALSAYVQWPLVATGLRAGAVGVDRRTAAPPVAGAAGAAGAGAAVVGSLVAAGAVAH